MTDDVKVILARLEGKFDKYASDFEHHLDESGEWRGRVWAKLNTLDQSLRGNGGDGINVRIDRIEQREKARSRFSWIALSTALAALVAGIRSWLTRP